MVVFDNLYYAVENSEALGYPFSNWRVAGKYDKWTNGVSKTTAEAPEKRTAIYLDNRDIARGKSSALTFTIASGYRARLKVYTEHNKYFTDNTKQAPSKNDVRIQKELLFDESMELIMFEGDYLSIDIDEEHSGIYRYRLRLGNKNYNVDDPEKFNNEVWVQLIEARLIDGGENEPKFGDDDIIIMPDEETIITGSNEDTDDDGIPDYLDYDPLDDEVQSIEDVDTDDDDDDDDGGDDGGDGGGDDDKKESGFSLMGVVIIGIVVIGIALLIRAGRKNKSSGDSNFTKSGSGGESGGE